MVREWIWKYLHGLQTSDLWSHRTRCVRDWTLTAGQSITREEIKRPKQRQERIVLSKEQQFS